MGSIELIFSIFADNFAIKNNKEFRLSKPEPYAKSPYFSREFIEESFRQPGGWSVPEGTSLIIPNDYSSAHFNISGGIRKTVGTPENYRNTIFIFGGSTIYNSEVPDSLTVASLLQNLINGNKLPYRVVNYGTTTIDSGQQLERLRREVKITNGDIVIFYDGVNDVLQKVWLKDATKSLSTQALEAPYFISLVRKMAEYSAFLRWYDKNYLTLKSYPIDFELINRASKIYLNNLNSAQIFTAKNKGKFIHFLQPNLYTKSPHNLYEIKLLNWGGNESPVGLRAIFQATYPVFQEMLANTGYSVDLVNIFDNLNYSPYLDFCHVTEIGNEVVANAIFETIKIDLYK
ncbi:hypothetical protein PHIN9_03060 [Polynucleobacter sp. HIN9]|nr:hypothetical protein PHIN9_03060 [Polynucleobacter sp. HIN9]